MSKKKQKDFSEEKTAMINSLKETKLLEYDFVETNNGLNNYHWVFQEEALKSIEVIKSHIRIILENLNSSVLFFCLCLIIAIHHVSISFKKRKRKMKQSQLIQSS